MKTSNIFYAKIMLFGEYSVINNSMALTIPYSHFNGELSYIFNDNYTDYDFAKQSNLNLYHYLGYLRKLHRQSKLLLDFDLERFSRDLDSGLYFESSIPEGYGVGSSGALIAALYDHYVENKVDVNLENDRKLIELKNHFAQLESFYHGTSSGIDPLNSYLKRPLLFGENKYIKAVDIHLPSKNPEFAVFLINSGKQGKTGPLVNIFLEKTKRKDGYGISSDHLNFLTNNAIQTIINGDNEAFFETLNDLSIYQLKHFDPMIPEGFRSLWRKGLEEESYFLKLCGSGGGGFLLGFTNDFPTVRKQMEKKELEVIPVYVHHMP